MLSVQYYSSCNIPTIWGGKPLVPAVNILSLTGFDFDAYKFDIASDNVFLTGECTLFYVLTKHIPLIECHIFGPWRCTRTVSVNQAFNEKVDLLLPYKSLHDYHGICFVLTVGCIEDQTKYDRPVALTHLSLYNSKKIFRRGLYELEMHMIRDPEVTTLDDIPSLLLPNAFSGKTKRLQELNFLLKMNRRAYRGELPHCSLAKVSQSAVSRRVHDLIANSRVMFLSVEFHFSLHFFCTLPVIHKREIIPLPAPEKRERRNPVDEKYVKISRNPRTVDVDRNRKPNHETLEKLKVLLMYPPHRDLSDAENDLIWKYRFYLSKQFPEESLSKFVLAVKWEYREQVSQALEMLVQWPQVAPEVVLELLTGRFKQRSVRNFAVRRLEEARDEVLLLYLYQLVQALRYEVSASLEDTVPIGTEAVPGEFSPSGQDLLEASQENSSDMNRSEEDMDMDEDLQEHESSSGEDDAELITRDEVDPRTLRSSLVLQDPQGSASESRGSRSRTATQISAPVSAVDPTVGFTLNNSTNDLNSSKDLATFLVERALGNHKLANYFFWYLTAEINSTTSQAGAAADKMYKMVLNRFCSALKVKSLDTVTWRTDLAHQTKFLQCLSDLMMKISETRYNRKQKIELLRQRLASSNSFQAVTSITNPFSFPLNPDFRVAKVDADSAYIFKSGKEPALLTLISTQGRPFKVIFKYGDDLRQDQLALQMIQLMDAILLKDNCNLQLTPYRVLAATDRAGFVEFIESTSISDVISKHRSILAYLQEVAPNKSHPHGVNKEVMSNYIRSLAGYCVITYLLGVGDRHTENLMITRQGQFFHIDFGFILGNDPKPMPAEIRLTKPMIEAMGGAGTNEFMDFSSLTFSVYLTLRRHANLFLTMFALVLDAGIKDVSREPNKVFDFLTERFCLGHSDEYAIRHFSKKMSDSVNAFMPELMERFHGVMQLLRN